MTRRADGRRDAAMAIALTVPRRWADADAWFPGRKQRGLTHLAKRTCARCAVRTECLDYALSGADTWGGIATGIWGRYHPQECDRLRRQRKVVAA
jgi:hypothetical protein